MSTSPIGSNAFLSSLQTSSSSGTSGSSTSGLGGLADVNTFYTLLVTQLTNQDPMNPLSNQDLSAQLAQFSTASGIQSMQQSMATLTAQLAQTQGLQAANLVGQTVVFDNNSVSLPASGTAAGGFTLASAAQNVQVQVVNSAGQTVSTLQLGALPTGVQTFTWDGSTSNGQQAPAGNYTFNVSATDGTGQSVAAVPFGTGKVQSVYLSGSNGPSLQLQGQSGTVPLSSIQGVM
ncbi:flagellar hook assembly protein FlgD [Thiomonas bhubaneswarensis]|uniref:Basal-body rod modification protein FlgD n=1 Tax=Thiomonas bhubaneswarensis TaxID=339866 RepID=A0A0K6I092_9BURK|nr:FlgD immunoglobulin-like domain containing protein [Thiomonas bhubaneswarensis]CUA96692.1 Flagellar hook assembly protein FlgD [Thiomonas bhubaneswarensis]